MPIPTEKRLAALEAIQRAQLGTAIDVQFEPRDLSALERVAWHAERAAIAARDGTCLLVVRFVSPKPYSAPSAPVLQ